ncbi:hypothetical protein CR513_18818, partial [Mucuna pruriens]
MGPFPISNGYSYILLVVDYISRWVEATATKTNDAKIVVDFLKSNIFCWFGVPKALISDQRSHFYNRAVSALLHKYGVVHRIATTYPSKQTAKLKSSIGKSRKHCKLMRIGRTLLRSIRELLDLQAKGKLCSKWDGPFIITHVFSYGVVELKDENTNSAFQVNEHQIKLFHEDPKIEITLRRLRKARDIVVSNSSDSVSSSDNSSPVTNISDFVEFSRTNNFSKSEQMENNDRTLKELATPDTYELKSGLIHLLPKFHGLVGEDPHKHLKEFHVVCSTMRSWGISEDYIKMKAFPFSLDGAAKDWLYLQSVLFNTWGDMKRMFLEKFFLASKTATIRKEICGIRKHFGETLHEYWERFNKLCAMCPHRQISEQLLIQYFYEGLTMIH